MLSEEQGGAVKTHDDMMMVDGFYMADHGLLAESYTVHSVQILIMFLIKKLIGCRHNFYYYFLHELSDTFSILYIKHEKAIFRAQQ